MANPTPLLILLAQEEDQEYSLYGAENYLLNSHVSVVENPSSSPQSVIVNRGINESWRLKIAEWSHEVVDHFNLSRETASIALNYVDRYMVFSKGRATCRSYKLLTLTSTQLAIKLHGMSFEPSGYVIKPSLSVFVALSRNQFSAQEIEGMELKLVHILKWRLNPPLPVNFVEELLHLLPDWQVGGSSQGCFLAKAAIYETSRYFSEVSVCVSDFTFLFKPSTVGFAAFLSAIDCLQEESSVSSIMPPKHVLSTFYDQVFSQTNLRDHLTEIEEAKVMLREVCPEMQMPTMISNPSRLASNFHDDYNGQEQLAERNSHPEDRDASPSGVAIHY